jgi:AcrR family transcriptional regulator
MPALSSPTRDRIVDAAMTLFAEEGFRGTSVARIERAAGLTPGAGGLYHHFGSKDEVLALGIQRHLDRLAALREIRRVLGTPGDLRAELSISARFFLAELDSQAELLRIVVSETRRRPDMLAAAVNQLIASTFEGFADWLREAADGTLAEDRAATIGSLALGSLLSSRLLRDVIGVTSVAVDDDTLVPEWVDMVMAMLRTDQAEVSGDRGPA